MPFPESQRVIYSKNPLNNVVCQVRFPPVLKIEAEIPSAFQEAIRADYPLFGEARAESILPPEMAKMIPVGLQVRTKQYQFQSADQVWNVTLSKDAVAIACSGYRRWEDFRSRFMRVFDALDSIYKPSFLSRTGLRYINLIRRSQLGLGEVGWKDLIKTYIAPEMDTPISSDLEDTEHILLVRLDRFSKARIYHGIAKIAEPAEEAYLIDNDFFTDQRIETGDALSRLDNFNRTSGHLFRWCIQNRLHEAMQPVLVQSQAPVA
jgi:uncharacterized protein (TIGR04255 family)